MTLTAQIPVATCEALSGSFDPAAPGQLRADIARTLQQAFDAAAGVILAESGGAHLHYLDVSTHPFRDLGDWRTLAGLPRTATGQLPDGARCLAVTLPLTDAALATLRNCAGALGIRDKYLGDTVNALLLVQNALNRLAARYPENGPVRPVMRGLGPELERVCRAFRFTGMGGVLDSAESVGNTEVWGHNHARPAHAPLFMTFRG